MIYSEVEKRLTKMATSPDAIQADMVELLADLKADYEGFTNTVAKLTEATDRIRDLQDTNARLFLRVTGQPDKSETEDEEKPKRTTPRDLGEILAEKETANNANKEKEGE